jgi:uncharacterized protein
VTEAFLNVSPGLKLPADVVTQKLAILAISGAGKSNAGTVLVEEMHGGGLPLAVIDPKGDWWGIRSNQAGTGPGLPILVLGGLHGDLPLTATSGPMVAELIAGRNLTCILDVSDFEYDTDQLRFLAEFGQALFRAHKAHPAPRHVILDEADEIVPQVPRGEIKRSPRDVAWSPRCIAEWTRIAKQGRSFGLGMTVISQRSANVSKNVLSQIEILIAMRVTGDLDLDAIAGWIRQHNADGELIKSLPDLLDGEAWVVSRRWLPGHGQEPVQRIRFRRRLTYDSGATPTLAAAVLPPATLASIDLDVIAAQMTAIAAEAEQNDPAALHRRIADLEQRLRETPGARLETENRELRAQLTAAQNRPPERVEVPVLTDADRQALAEAGQALADAADAFRLIDKKVAAALPAAAPSAAAPSAAASPARPAASRAAAGPETPRRGTRPAPARPTATIPGLPAGAARMLLALARMHPVKLTRAQLAALARIKRSGGTFGTYLSLLRTGGLITDDGRLLAMTPAGLSACGMAGRRPVTGPQVLEMWRAALPAGARTMFDLLLQAAPGHLTRAELATGANLELGGGTFSTYLSTLRANGLALVNGEQVSATAEILSAVRPQRHRKSRTAR